MQLPDVRFYLFGMGARRKLLYKQGILMEAQSGEVVRSWQVVAEHIEPSEYRVCLELADWRRVVIAEDERGVWLEEDSQRYYLTENRVELPRFDDHPHAALLRVLHQEILINIVNGVPVPNFFVYTKPWYRDAAMMCMCLKKTNNLHLVQNWIRSLREPFDRNNAGHNEPDNLGQALYMIAQVADAAHPLVETILQIIPDFRRNDYIIGMSDFQEHPVYQTKWLKYGLHALGLDDPYCIPEVYDSYSALFWMDYRDAHVSGAPFNERANERYPYLAWAEAHFHNAPPPVPLPDATMTYPLTWEAHASQANYSGMAVIGQEYVARKICTPHAWHAVEMFLYLLDHT